MPLSGSKSSLRVQYKQRRKAWTDAQRVRMHEALTDEVTALPLFRDLSSALLCYASRSDEADTWKILRAAWQRGKTVALPRCAKDGQMAFYRVSSESELQCGMLGIREPSAGCPLYLPTPDDLCIVPGLAFDRRGFRLGYGGGYYDRFLAEYPMHTIGLCYPNCLADVLPSEPFDIPVRQVICCKDPKEA